MLICYHGCTKHVIKKLLSGEIDISLGGGELGRGFYSTLNLWVAKRWTWYKYQSKTVLKLEILDEHFFELDVRFLTDDEAIKYRKSIKYLGETRTYLFNKDIVWSPIVGDQMVGKKEEQIKWESKKAEQLLNSDLVKRSQV